MRGLLPPSHSAAQVQSLELLLATYFSSHCWSGRHFRCYPPESPTGRPECLRRKKAVARGWVQGRAPPGCGCPRCLRAHSTAVLPLPMVVLKKASKPLVVLFPAVVLPSVPTAAIPAGSYERCSLGRLATAVRNGRYQNQRQGGTCGQPGSSTSIRLIAPCGTI